MGVPTPQCLKTQPSEASFHEGQGKRLHTHKVVGQGGATLASPRPGHGQEPHGIQSASTGPVPWVSNLHPTPSLSDTTHTQPPQRGRLRVQKHQAAGGVGGKAKSRVPRLRAGVRGANLSDRPEAF